ncbi:hypothetical protein LCGC14_2055920 [marine sediment metagenome]|uniref:Uncharacterized protein n=1 Tax=marine sediment metagenome TaxID=412755 RepID=A0A0F9FA54_9ZZZZ
MSYSYKYNPIEDSFNLVGGQVSLAVSLNQCVFKQTFTGNGSQTQFQLNGTENATFTDGSSWSSVKILNTLPSYITKTNKGAIYDSINIFTRNRITVSSINGSGLVTLSHIPRDTQQFIIWYWYDLATTDTIDDYYREDFVTTIEGEKPVLIATDITFSESQTVKQAIDDLASDTHTQNTDTILLSGGSGAEELINNGILQISLLPYETNILELGSQTIRFKKIWVGGGSVEIGDYSIKSDTIDNDGLEIPATLHIHDASGVSGNICLHSGTEPAESLSANGHRLWMDASGNLQHIKPSSGGNRQIAYAVDLHAHSNQTLLDTYTQTEVDIADAVSLKHWNNNDHIHANHPELDSITDGFHDSRTNDPHSVTKAQVGLPNVPNLDTTNAVNKAHTQNSDTDLDSTFEATFVKKLDNINVLSDITSPGADIEDAVTKRHSNFSDHTKNEDYKIEFVGDKAARVGCWGGERPEFSFITFIEYDEEIMRITDGKVGIRTDTPVEQLDVRGAVIAKDGFATKLWDVVGANFEIADPYIEYISPNQQGGRYGTVYRQYWSGSLSDNDVIVSSIATRIVDGYINKRSGTTRFPGGVSDMESASWHARYGLNGTSGAGNIFIDLAGYTTIAGWVDYTKT